MVIMLLDDSLRVEVLYDEEDQAFEDNICVCLSERAPAEERLFLYDDTHILLTPDQALDLARALTAAAEQSQQAAKHNLEGDQ